MCYTKRFISLCWVMLLLAITAVPSFWNVLKAQPNIQTLEYYIDNDPGFGNATKVTGIGAVNATVSAVNIPTSSLSSGVHVVGIRCQDAKGVWSLDYQYLFLNPFAVNNANTLAPLPNLQNMEYYIDNDPGFGKATPITGFGGSNTSPIVNIPTSSITSGVHVVGIRCQDANGVWSIDYQYLFFKPYATSGTTLAPIPNLQEMEYYIDNDPGFGKGNTITGFSGGTDIVNIPTGSLSSGVHLVGIRAKDANGVWSLDYKYMFLNPYTTVSNNTLAPIPNLLGMEYYIDNDPGYGKGIQLSGFSGSTASSAMANIPLSSLSYGVHIVGIRSLDANGIWSLDYKYLFLNNNGVANTTLAPIPNLTRLEYYLDTDPGYGKANTIPFTAGTNVVLQNLPIPVGSLVNGTNHNIGIRGQDANGVWSLDAKYTFQKTPDTANIITPLSIVGCSGSVTYKGKTYTSSTVVRDTVVISAKQDSITVATITVQNISAVEKDTSIYGCKNVVYNNVLYSTNAIRKDTLRTTQGCDSVYIVATINVSQLTPVTNTISLSGCRSVTYKGVTYTSSAIRRDTLRTNWGCDSVYNIANITIYGIVPVSESVSLVDCKSVTYNGITYTKSTTRYDTLRSVNGCDSVYKVANITINSCSDIIIQNITSTPDSVSSMGTLSLSWQVKNIGDNVTGAGWSEFVYLKNSNGDSVSLGTVYYNNVLNAGALVSRTAYFVIPNTVGVNGWVNIEVKLIPAIGLIESPTGQNNNLGQSSKPLFVRSSISLKPDLTTLYEISTKPVACLLSRNGSWAVAQTFRISASDPARLSVPDSVVIPAGSSGAVFYINTINNNILNIDSTVSIMVSGAGYVNLTTPFTIIDDEMPALTLSSTKSSMNEGDTATLTIQRQIVNSSPLTVSLSCSKDNLFAFNPTATIPANQKSVKIIISAIDNTVPNLSKTLNFTANAFGYSNATNAITLNDNDIPVLTLLINPDSVTKSGGYQAAIATIHRQGSTANPITINLSDNSTRNDLYYSTTSVTFNSGESDKQVNIGVVNNNLVDGNHDVMVSANVYIPECNCTATGVTGSVASKITVIDDNAASIKISVTQNTLPEGVTNASNLVITRNTATFLPLTIMLSSDRDTELVYAKSVTIPAGSSSVSIPVSALGRTVSLGDRMVTFTAVASGYVKGICWALISDRTLPDAVVSITPQKDSTLASGTVQSQIIVKNIGVANFPAGVYVDLYISNQAQAGGNKTYLTTLSTSKVLFPNGSDTLGYTLSLPNFVGQYYLYAEINSSGTVAELSYLNNISSYLPLYLKPRYIITSLLTNKLTYQPGDSVLMTGKAVGFDGASVALVPVEIYTINDGYRNSQTVTTDSNGYFKAGYLPLFSAFGHYIAGGSYPNMSLTIQQVSFDIYGLKRASTDNIVWDVFKNDTTKGVIQVINPGVLSLTKLKVQLLTDTSLGFRLTFDSIPNMAGGSIIQLKYTLIGTKVSTALKYLPINLKLTTNEGAYLNLVGYFFCRSPRSDIRSNITSITTTMTKGGSRSYQFTITNLGKGATGNITVTLPSLPWMTLSSPVVIPSLANGEHADVVLQFSPDNSIPVSTVFNGTIAIATSDSGGIAMPFNITTVSTATGKLSIDVRDDYTYNTAAAPHLSGASVLVYKHFSSDIVAKGITDVNGLFNADSIVEGYYDIQITAANHDSYSNTVLIDPGMTNNLIVNLSFNAITYNWTVVPTTVQDVYTVQTTAVFTTNVPAPVVEVKYPDSIPYNNQIFKIVAINHGMIAANHVRVVFPTQSGMHFEMLSDSIHSLGAQQSAEIWVKLTVDNPNATHYTHSGVQTSFTSSGASNSTNGGSNQNGTTGNLTSGKPVGSAQRIGLFGGGGGGGDCFEISLPVIWDWLCGNNKSGGTQKLFGYGDCPTGTQKSENIPVVDDGGGGGGLGNISIPGNFVPVNGCNITGINMPTLTFCDGCLSSLYNAYKACRKNTKFNCVGSTYTFIKDVAGNKASAMDQAKDALSVASCLADACNKLFLAAAAASAATTPITGPGGAAAAGTAGTIAGYCKVVGTIITIYLCQDGVRTAIKTCWPDLAKSWGFHFKDNKSKILGSQNANAVPTTLSTPAFVADYYRKLSIGLQKLSGRININNEVFGSTVWNDCQIDDLSSLMNYVQTNYSDTGYVDSSDVNLDKVRPSNISRADFLSFIERYNNTNKLIAGKLVIGTNFIRNSYIANQLDTMRMCEDSAIAMGYTSVQAMMDDASANFETNLEASSHSVCASVSLQFNQTITMTREAFRGNLNVFNGHPTETMKNIQLNLVIKDVNGNIAGPDLFQVSTESLKNLTAIDSTGTLLPQDTGSATILFIPSKYAAPTAPVKYSFGGTLSYLDPFTGLTVVKNLDPSVMTVNPSPDLTLTYFMQRNVLGDDPLTPTIVEPSIPAEFSLLINNRGVGTASNFSIVSDSPRIVDNQKGLLVNFNLVGSSLNGAPATKEFKTLTFDSISGNGTKIIQWYFTSSLLGHFSDYNIKLTHASSYSNPNLSLISDVSVHELIRSISVPGTVNSPFVGFMANDIVDAIHFPDALYVSDGRKLQVFGATSASSTKVSDSTYSLSIVPSQSGWNYNNIIDPTNGTTTLIRVIRLRDSANISLRNFWQTDRTMRDASSPIYEKRLHFVDSFSGNPETYLLVFASQPDTVLGISRFVGVPYNISDTQVHRISVVFNKSIDASSFNTSDISLMCQGKVLDLSSAAITQVSDTSFLIDLANTTLTDGYYVFGVQTNGITDKEGYTGKTGKTIGWTQYLGGNIALGVQVLPDISYGTVTPLTNLYQYGTNVVFSAKPKIGYNFSNWTIDGNIYSTDTAINYLATVNKVITANFVKKTSHVSVIYDSTMANVTGNVNGLFDYGSIFNLNATVNSGYAFVNWKVNGNNYSTQKSLSVTANSDLIIEAVTKQQVLPVISWSNLTDSTCRVTLGNAQLNATCNVNGHLNYTPSAGTVLQSGDTYPITVNFTPTDTVNYLSASKTVFFTIKTIHPVNIDTAVQSCTNIIYNGQTFTSSTIKRDTLRNLQGCDSVYRTATITITPIVTVTNSNVISGCNGVVYKNKTYTTSTVVRDTLKTLQGCDSIYNVTSISVNKITPVVNTIHLDSCNGITYKSITYNASVTIRDTLKSYQGCDSIYNVVIINILRPTSSTTNASICNGGSYTFNGTAYSTAGSYTAHLTNSLGCDSVSTLVLTVKPTSSSTTNASICIGDSYTFNGTTYSTAGTYTPHLTNSVGCDSVATLVLIVKPTSGSTTNASICDGGSYTFNGTTYSAAGTYTAHLTNSVGCDSVATLVLIVKPISGGTTNASICIGGSYTFNGTTYSAAGTYTAHLTNSLGCDSVATLVLIVKPTSGSTTNASICDGGSYTFNGTNYINSGTYTAHLTNSLGCDSVSTLVLTIKPTSSSNTNVSICNGGFYTFNGTTYSTAGTYTAHLTNSLGCDSVATLVMTVKPISSSTTNASICNGGSYTFNGTTYSTAGTYTSHLTNSLGCDSVATLELTIKPTSSSTTNVSICNGGSYTFNGTSYTNAGIYTAHLTNSLGCDSVATLILIVKPTSVSNTNLDICSSQLPYTWNGLLFNGAGTQTAHLTNSVGCDSAATLVLTVSTALTPSMSISANPSGSIITGTSVTFTATPTNGGSSPIYQWKKNGSNVGTNSNSYSNASLVNGDVISCMITANNSCQTYLTATSNEIAMNVTETITWQGAVSSDWNNAANWNLNIVPSVNSSVTILAVQRLPVLSTDVIVDTLNLGGNLSINGHTLTINGAVIGSGTLKGSPISSLVIGGTAGTLLFDANNNSLSNLTVINSGSATLGNALDIYGTFTPSSGTFNTGDKLTLKSTSIDNTAVVGIVGGIVNGKVTVERFIPNGLRTYRDLGASGVANAGHIFDNWQESGVNTNGYGIYITGSQGQSVGTDPITGFDYSYSGNHSLFTYLNNSWDSVLTTRGTILDPYQGFRVLVRGNRSGNLQNQLPYMWSNTTLRTTGNLISGQVNYSTNGVSGNYPSSFRLTSDSGSCSFIANPYRSIVDWEAVAAQSHNVNMSYWYCDPTNTTDGTSTGYTVFVGYNALAHTTSNPLGTSMVNRYLQPGEAFFVENSSNDSPSIVFNEIDKVPNEARLGIFEQRLLQTGLLLDCQGQERMWMEQ